MGPDAVVDYHQPEFYHFSSDSTQLAQFVSEQITSRHLNNVLDLGAGCGVIGLEFYSRFPQINKLILMEQQNAFGPFIQKNIDQFNGLNAEVLMVSWSDFILPMTFELILSNPPYYFNDSSRPSGDARKDSCQRMSRQSLEDYLRFIQKHLAANGVAYASLSTKGDMLGQCLKYQERIGLKMEVIPRSEHLSFLRMVALNIK